MYTSQTRAAFYKGNSVETSPEKLVRDVYADDPAERFIPKGQGHRDHLTVAHVQTVLGDGSGLGVSIAYAHQEGEAGIADALAQARPHVGDDRIVAILGDNLYQDDLRSPSTVATPNRRASSTCFRRIRAPAG